LPRPMKTVLAVALTAAAVAAPSADARWQHFGAPAPVAAAPTTGQLLQQAKRALAPGGPATDLTPILKQLAQRLPNLHGSQRRDARALLARPTDGSADPQASGYTVDEAAASPSCSAHFCVHWVTSTEDAPDLADANGNDVPDYAETVLSVAEFSYSVENDQLGWRAPKSDGTRGGGAPHRVDIYLKQLGGTGIYGYSAPDPDQPDAGGSSMYAYLVIDDDFDKAEFPQYDSPLTPLDVTLAHEYNHVLQFGYDSHQDTWMFESTAVWMEGKVYPEAFDYLQYLPGWVQLVDLPLTSFNGSDPNDRNNVKVYGTAVWNKWLDARYGPEVVRGAWERSLQTDVPSFAVAAYDRSIRDHEGNGFGDEFDRFAAATAEWQAANSGFPEGSLYRDDVVRRGSIGVNGPGGLLKLNHTTYALVDVRHSDAPRIKLGITAPTGTAAAVALVGRTGGVPGGSSTVQIQPLPKGGRGSVVLENPGQYSRVTGVLVNSDTKVSGASDITGDFIYSRDNQQFFARVTTDFTGPRVVRVSPSSGRRAVSRRTRVKVVFSEPVLGVTKNSFQLRSAGGGLVRARLIFQKASRTAVLVPNVRLRSGARYTVKVSRSVIDTAVNPLTKASLSSFRTAG
jgi:hypothetical protein